MSAMWIGKVERPWSPDWRASRSMELMSPTSSRRLARSKSRKVSNSLEDIPAWFFLGFESPELETCSTRCIGLSLRSGLVSMRDLDSDLCEPLIFEGGAASGFFPADDATGAGA